MDPSEFLVPTNNIDFDDYSKSKGNWPVRFIEMGRRMQDLVEGELMHMLKNPVVNEERDSLVVFSLDNIEFWR